MQISQQLSHLNFPIGEGHVLYKIFGLVDTVYGSNLGNMEYHQLVVDNQPNLMVKISYLRGL